MLLAERVRRMPSPGAERQEVCEMCRRCREFIYFGLLLTVMEVRKHTTVFNTLGRRWELYSTDDAVRPAFAIETSIVYRRRPSYTIDAFLRTNLGSGVKSLIRSQAMNATLERSR